MKTEQTTRQKRIHRENMHLYVFEPSRDFAMARFITGIGYGLLVFSIVSLLYFVPLAAVVFTFAIGCVAAGWGWGQMLDDRLLRYHSDIMSQRGTDETTITHRDEPKFAQREIPDQNGNIITTLETVGKLSPREWRDVAFAIRLHGVSISQAALAKNKETKCMSQLQYKWWYSYMITNHLLTDGQPNELTQVGIDKLDAYLAPSPGGDTSNFNGRS